MLCLGTHIKDERDDRDVSEGEVCSIVLVTLASPRSTREFVDLFQTTMCEPTFQRLKVYEDVDRVLTDQPTVDRRCVL